MKREKTVDEERTIKHPSFGIISIGRVNSSSSENLFGSSVKHRSWIQLEINRASLLRRLSGDHVFEEGLPIIRLLMTPVQFADMITSLNQSGTPCTIDFVDGHSVEPSQMESKRMQFDAEFEEKMKLISKDTSEYYKQIDETLARSSVGVRDRKTILGLLDTLKMQIESNMPFIQREFDEHMDKVVLEAKGVRCTHGEQD